MLWQRFEPMTEVVSGVYRPIMAAMAMDVTVVTPCLI